MASGDQCGNCRFFQFDERLEASYGRAGWCRRNPPHLTYVDQVTNRLLSRFAAVPETWWCGEYRREHSQPTEGD